LTLAGPGEPADPAARIATNDCQMLRRRKVPLSLEALLEQAATAEHRPPEPKRVPVQAGEATKSLDGS